VRREHSTPRDGWPAIVESQGLSYHETSHPEDLVRPYWDESVHYLFDMDEVLSIEADVELLHDMCLKAVDYVISSGRYADFGIPYWVAPAIEASWKRSDPYLFGRFDLRYDGTGPAKLLEYNADTPTSLVESSIIQWYWLQDTHPADDQWNSLHERLVDGWKALAKRIPSGPVHFSWTDMDDSGEEIMTIAYLQETAEQAGLDAIAISIEDIGWHSEKRKFLDLQEREIRSLAKLYPWEWVVQDPFGEHAVASLPTMAWIEPIWKMLLSNKALLAILWELHPGHPNLLPAYLNTPGPLLSYIRKPLLGREGASMEIVTPQGSQATPGGYGAEGFVYQEFIALPDFEGQHPVLGAWMVGHESAGLGIRETSGLITDDTSSFVPHRISGN
jgi:glutathionylspermidine synthase